MSDLKVVDGKNNDLETHEFDLHFDKVYKWFAINLQERQNFIMQLWKYCCRHLPKEKPNFENIPNDWLIDMSSPKKDSPILEGRPENFLLLLKNILVLTTLLLDFLLYKKNMA